LGGAKIECADRFDVDDALSIHIRAADRDARELPAVGKVTWMQRKNQGIYAYGLSFADLPREAAERFAAGLEEEGGPAIQVFSPFESTGA
jgi:hypothetical protein